MDSIEYRNRQVAKEEIEKKDFVITKRGRTKNTVEIIVAVKLTEEECKTVRKTKALIPRITETLKDGKVIEFADQIKDVYHCGELNQFTQYEKIVSHYPQRLKDIKEGRDIHYRDYTRTREGQEANMHLVNICRDSRTSWQSVAKKLRSNYGILVRVVILILKEE
jgi:hypothetical protein